MPVIKTNEQISKEMPTEVVKALLALLERYNVPASELRTWIVNQPDLYIALRNQLRKEANNVR